MSIRAIVEAKGEKFNGSVKLDGKWFSFKKGVDHSTVVVGKEYEFKLEDWESNGKSGKNIAEVLPVATKTAKKETVAEAPVKSVGRDFDKEARGKTLCQYIQAQLSNPSLDIYDTEGIIERARRLVEETFK